MFDRIVTDPAILGGKPILKGTRISVEMVLEWIASGAGPADVVASYPHLELEDAMQAVRYAARALQNEVVITAA